LVICAKVEYFSPDRRNFFQSPLRIALGGNFPNYHRVKPIEIMPVPGFRHFFAFAPPFFHGHHFFAAAAALFLVFD